MSENYQNYVYNSDGNLIDTFPMHLKKIFLKMTIAMALTAAVAFAGYEILEAGGFLANIFANPISMIIIIILQLGIALGFRSALFKATPTTCDVMLYVYAGITGVTFSVLPYAYTSETLFTAFLFAAVLFASCAVIGYTTNVDLTKLRGILFAGLIALIVCSIASLFIPALRDNLLISYIGLVIFLCYTAYDIQMIKNNYEQFKYNPAIAEKFSSFGAFELYLDFINLFIRILQILASSRSRK